MENTDALEQQLASLTCLSSSSYESLYLDGQTGHVYRLNKDQQLVCGAVWLLHHSPIGEFGNCEIASVSQQIRTQAEGVRLCNLRSLSEVLMNYHSCVRRLAQDGVPSVHSHEPPSRLFYLWLLLRWDCRLRVLEQRSQPGNEDAFDIVLGSIEKFPVLLPSTLAGMCDCLVPHVQVFLHDWTTLPVPALVQSTIVEHSREVYCEALCQIMASRPYWYEPETGMDNAIFNLKYFLAQQHYVVPEVPIPTKINEINVEYKQLSKLIGNSVMNYLKKLGVLKFLPERFASHVTDDIANIAYSHFNNCNINVDRMLDGVP